MRTYYGRPRPDDYFCVRGKFKPCGAPGCYDAGGNTASKCFSLQCPRGNIVRNVNHLGSIDGTAIAYNNYCPLVFANSRSICYLFEGQLLFKVRRLSEEIMYLLRMWK